MDAYHYICIICHSDIYYNRVKYHGAVCNRPDCSTSVDKNHTGYSEDHPKAVSICRSCSGLKKRQSGISTFFQTTQKRSYAGPCKVRICPYLAYVSPHLDLSPNTDTYRLYKAHIYGSFRVVLIKKSCLKCHKIVQLYISKYFP